MDAVMIYLLVSTAICGVLTLTRKGESAGWKLFAIVTMLLIGALGWVRFGGAQ
jgi:hypothetical protein